MVLQFSKYEFVSQAEIEQQYSQLQDLTTQRRQKLLDSKKLYEFYHEADTVEGWLADRALIAGSEDYGQDLEHVEVSDSCESKCTEI